MSAYVYLHVTAKQGIPGNSMATPQVELIKAQQLPGAVGKALLP